MSPKHQNRPERRSLAKVENRQAARSMAQVVEDPITIGLDKTIHVNLGKLPPPPNVYDADAAWIEHRPGTVSLFFAKRNRDKADTLRTRLEVRYPPENLAGHFWGNSRQFHESLSTFVARWPAEAITGDGVDATRMTAEKEHSEWANFDTMAHAGSEASIDFYLMPPSGIAQFTRGLGSSGLQFVPVVRIQLTVFELHKLLNAVDPIVAAIKEYMPKKTTEEVGEDV